MNLGLPRYLTLGLLLAASAALALAMGYWNIRPASFTPADVERDNARPDFYIDNARIQMLDEQGQVAYRLTAEHAVHQIEDGSTRLQQPELLFYRGDNPTPWLLKAANGLVTEKGDRVDLDTDVLLQQQPEGQPQRQLTTSALTLFPRRDYAETDQSVRIEAARSVTTAEGMQLFLNDGRLQLLSTVRGQYEVR
ncbi:LPS export ABC transporter periplasmic protein LptC [Halopseudomonas maritima]|uniref:LPS export ABC transporter periplasmic protein LptC n=1 Tax=Halopseudomonas maritima TaxID=2918528 RepID=UPI001EEA312C|nr:LPS export ABC transporter periplasmic protein LptC [Halopseudomonas maritima]UJJ30639.1 LPS export ABC transporter periplasmic protein LptC [Halopseudomonas maritima]